MFRFSLKPRRVAKPAKPSRVYAIGDIHGRADLFNDLIGQIEADVGIRSKLSTKVVVLGDFIDRGPDSAAVITMLMRLTSEPNLIVLRGNHEATLVDALDGNHDALDLWLEHGGLATLRSFGVDTDGLDRHDTYRLLRIAREAIPTAVRRWLEKLPTYIHIGRHYFVHAGIDPDIALDAQVDADRLWIRDKFTLSAAPHEAIVVHGHTIYEDGVDFASNRIGVDTGAYRTGRLSAVGLEDDEAWVITTEPRETNGG